MNLTVSEILDGLVKNFAAKEKSGDWWGHDTNLGNMDEEFAEAERQLNELIREATIDELEVVLGSPEDYDDMTTYVESRIAHLKDIQDRIAELKGKL